MWKCKECGAETERLRIQWGMSGGSKVDILDYFCPSCPSNELTFLGTKKEEDAYWEMEWNDVPKKPVKVYRAKPGKKLPPIPLPPKKKHKLKVSGGRWKCVVCKRTFPKRYGADFGACQGKIAK